MEQHIFRLFFTIFLALCCAFGFAQNDTLNQLDARGRKTGLWRIYLDSIALETDSANSFFIAYDHYDSGKPSADFFSSKWKKRDSCLFGGNFPEKGKPQPANGSFTWFDKHQKITFEEFYENGQLMRRKEVRYKNYKGVPTWAFIRTDFVSKRYRKIPGTYYIQEHNNQKIYNMTEFYEYWYRKGKFGWKRYKIRKGPPI